MIDWLSLIISLCALLISFFTAWFAFLRKGKLLMTQPTVIFFGPDGYSKKPLHNKIFLRTLLYSTSKRGQVIESMHVRVERDETKQNFYIWVYGDKKLSRGSGLFVSEKGIACNHHFLLPKEGIDYRFIAGDYKLKVFAKLIGKNKAIEIFSTNIHIDKEQGRLLQNSATGIYFDWGPDQNKYYTHIETRTKDNFNERFFSMYEKYLEKDQTDD